jgi:uncharacterized radical SAM superfamily Fe-S cluster-containing enzyme
MVGANRSSEQRDQARERVGAAAGLHVLAKPIGPVCDIKCDYCFYLEKHALFDKGENYRMSDEVLAAYIRQYIEAQPTPVVEFVWHGGEPTLLGLDFFRKVVELQQPPGRERDQECPADQRHASHRRVVRVLQGVFARSRDVTGSKVLSVSKDGRTRKVTQ